MDAATPDPGAAPEAVATADAGAVPEALAPLLLSENGEKHLNLNFNYSIQVGAFLEREGAFRRASELRRKGYDAYVLELWGVKDPSRLWQSVRIGRFDDAAAALAAASAFRDKEGVGAYAARSDSFSGARMKEEPSAGQAAAVRHSSARVEKVEAATGESVGSVAVSPSGPPVDDAPEAADAVSAPSVEVSGAADAVPSGSSMTITPVSAAAVDPVPARAPVMEPPPGQTTAPAVTTMDVADDAGVTIVADAPEVVPAAVVPAASTRQATVRPVQRPPWMVAKVESMRQQVVSDAPGLPFQTSAETTGDAAPETRVAMLTRPASSGERPAVAANAAVSPGGSAPAAVTPPTGQGTGAQDDLLFAQSEEARGSGDPDREEELLLLTLRTNPRHGPARRRLARLYVETDRSEKALTLLQEAVSGRGVGELVDGDPNLAAFLAALYQRQEEHWKAIDHYENLLNRYPRKGIWRMGMGISLEKVNEPGEALRAYELALGSGGLNRKLQQFVQKRIQALR